jgi:hypothetical protein
MNRNDKPTIVSLETHRRQRVAASKAKAVQAKKARAAAAAARSERAVNWRRVPLALLAFAALLVAGWLVKRLMG